MGGLSSRGLQVRLSGFARVPGLRKHVWLQDSMYLIDSHVNSRFTVREVSKCAKQSSMWKQVIFQHCNVGQCEHLLRTDQPISNRKIPSLSGLLRLILCTLSLHINFERSMELFQDLTSCWLPNTQLCMPVHLSLFVSAKVVEKPRKIVDHRLMKSHRRSRAVPFVSVGNLQGCLIQ